MAFSAFDDKSHSPQPEELKHVLGKSARLWDELISHIEARFPPVTHLWNFAGAKYGWSLRLKKKDRIILYMTPQPGAFQAGLVLGDKAIKAARDAKLPAAIIQLIDNAPKYAEGTGIRIPVTTKETMAAVEQLATLKMSA